MAEETASTFTSGETALLVTIMRNLKSSIDFDADAVASQLGYKSGNIVKTRWGQIKRKKIDGAGVAAGATPGGVKKKVATPKKGKGKGKVGKGGDGSGDGSGDDEEERIDTPMKGKEKGKGKGKAKEDNREGHEKAVDGEKREETDGAGNAKVKAEAESDLEF